MRFFSENIKYGALFRKVTEDEVRRAAIAANINNFILSLPDVNLAEIFIYSLFIVLVGV